MLKAGNTELCRSEKKNVGICGTRSSVLKGGADEKNDTYNVCMFHNVTTYYSWKVDIVYGTYIGRWDVIVNKEHLNSFPIYVLCTSNKKIYLSPSLVNLLAEITLSWGKKQLETFSFSALTKYDEM